MTTREIDLPLQFIGANPMVISFQNGLVPAVAGCQSRLEVSQPTDVLLSEQKLDSVRVAAMVILGNRSRAVG